MVRFRQGEEPAISLTVPLASAIMQSVSDHSMAHRARPEGGISFIFVSQSIEKQAEMVEKVKKFKAGFVVSDSNLRPEATPARRARPARADGPHDHGRHR